MPQAIGALIIAAADIVGPFIGVGETGLAGTTVLGVQTEFVVGSIFLEGAAIGASLALAPSNRVSVGKLNTKNPVSPRVRGYGLCRRGAIVPLRTA
jgi:hypothetical protein